MYTAFFSPRRDTRPSFIISKIRENIDLFITLYFLSRLHFAMILFRTVSVTDTNTHLYVHRVQNKQFINVCDIDAHIFLFNLTKIKKLN